MNIGQVAGLRERHREDRRRRILLAAGSLFTNLGFDQTSVETIAAEAAVSVPTIYSYFVSKSDLLLGLLEEDKRLMRTSLDALLKHPPSDPVEAVLAIITAELEGGYDVTHKPLWREISAAALRATPERRRDYLKLQEIHVEPLAELLRRLQRQGIVRREIDIESGARALYAVSRNCFRLYLMIDKASVGDLRRMVEQDIRSAFTGYLTAARPGTTRTKRSSR